MSEYILAEHQLLQTTSFFSLLRHPSVFTLHISYLCLSKLLPHSPAWNTNRLDNTDHHLGHEDEEESHKVERAVGPAWREQ